MVGILGAGESGTYAALLAKKMEHEVFLSEIGEIDKGYKALLEREEIPFEEMGHSFEKLVESDLIVKSPGIPDTAGIVKRLGARGIPVISELEFAFTFSDARIIAITGSNGKTTTTNLIHHLLRTCGFASAIGGNIGRSFSNVLLEDEEVHFYVLEVSSFQLDGIQSFRPDYAMILNITADHLDRYNFEFEDYAKSKMKILENQQQEDTFYFRSGDETVTRLLKRSPGMGRKQEVDSDGRLYREFGVENIFLLGDHNAINASFAIELLLELGALKEDIMKGLQSFRNDDHRLQFIGSFNGVTWINDSKATNVQSVYYALKSMRSSIIWIAGGVDKGNNYDELMDLVKQKVRILICLGKDNEKLTKAFGNRVEEVRQSGRLSEVVAWAYELANKGETVLLSPACASFDLFKNYEERGTHFVKEVWAQLPLDQEGEKIRNDNINERRLRHSTSLKRR